MLKMPSGSGCDVSEDSQQQQQHLPMAVAVPMGAPSLHRQRSNNANGSGNGASPVQRRKTAHQFSFRSLVGGDYLRLADYAGKVILVVNVASHCNSTGKGYHQLNELAVQYPELVIIACPCNQFGHQENLVGEEIYLSLKHIRPGKGFEPKFPLTEKIEVNGSNAHPLFNFLKISLPYASDRTLLDEMSAPSGVFSHPMRIIWMPVSRADISWNFEKFLIGPDGVPFKRYSPKCDTKIISDDIAMLSKVDMAKETQL